MYFPEKENDIIEFPLIPPQIPPQVAPRTSVRNSVRDRACARPFNQCTSINPCNSTGITVTYCDGSPRTIEEVYVVTNDVTLRVLLNNENIEVLKCVCKLACVSMGLQPKFKTYEHNKNLLEMTVTGNGISWPTKLLAKISKDIVSVDETKQLREPVIKIN
ncbi:hypothetical protein [Pteropox virus]|uniref:Uncharacterized protein n=1 Tax=Pteropox virus TaxID=1873698 RepID=A0A1B1MRP4_9POXV|nr:hypothetical protein [Pteropox virus]ANS71220.1 hypothetical protein [Pteropox virus]